MLSLLQLTLVLLRTRASLCPHPFSPGQSNLSLLPFEEASPVASSSIKSVVDAVVDHVLGGGDFGLEHSDKMISLYDRPESFAKPLFLFFDNFCFLQTGDSFFKSTRSKLKSFSER